MNRVSLTNLLKTAPFIFTNGLFYSLAAIFANVLNLAFNLYLGIHLPLKDFGLIALFMGLLYGVQILTQGLSITTHRTVAIGTRVNWGRKILSWSIIFSMAWLFVSPLLASQWSIEVWTVASFALVVLIAPCIAYVRGLMLGNDGFGHAGTLFIFESAARLLLAVGLVVVGLGALAYLSIPVSFVATAFLIFWLFQKEKLLIESFMKGSETEFPYRLFLFSVLLGLSTLVYLSFDIVLARTLMSDVDAGAYALLALVGKILFFTASLLGVVLISGVGQSVRENRSTLPILYGVMLVVVVLLLCGLVIMYWFGELLLLTVFSTKATAIIPYITTYLLAISIFAITHTFALYHHTLGRYRVTVSVCLASLLFPMLVFLQDSGLEGLIDALLVTALVSLTVVLIVPLCNSSK